MRNFQLNTLAIIMATVSSHIFAQGVPNNFDLPSYISQKSISSPLQGYEYTGSPYENRAFQLGNVYGDGKLLASNVALRYNALRDEFEIKKSVNTSNYDAKVLVQDEAISVRITNQTFIYVPKKSNEDVGGYFEVLLNGDNMSLYRKITKEYVEGKKSINSITSDILPMYREKDELYFLNNAGKLIEVPGSRNGKINSFGMHKKALKDYIRSEKINVNKIGDLKKLLVFYNSIP